MLHEIEKKKEKNKERSDKSFLCQYSQNRDYSNINHFML